MKLKLYIPVALGIVCLLMASNASAYRAIYVPHLIEYGVYLSTFNYSTAIPDRRLAQNIIPFLAGPNAPIPYNVCILQSIGTTSWYNSFWGPGYGYQRHDFNANVMATPGRPVTASYLAANNCNVVVLSDAWHYGYFYPYEDWGYSPSEAAEILSHLESVDGGLLVTSGSFSCWTNHPTGSKSNYDSFAEMMGIEATTAATCDSPSGLCPCCFPWTIENYAITAQCPGYYPPSYPFAVSPYYEQDPDGIGHDVHNTPNVLPPTQRIYYPYLATWMAVTEATQVGHVNHSYYTEDSLHTVKEGAGLAVEVTAEFRDMPFKGHPVAVWVTATNIGEDPALDNDIPIAMTSMDLSASITDTHAGVRAEPDVANDEYYLYEFNDLNGDGDLDIGESATWAFVAIMPWGPPDETVAIKAKFCEDAVDPRCKGGSIEITTDSCKHNIADELNDDISVYRHYQKALIFIRTAWRNGVDIAPALELMRQNTDDAFKTAHGLVSDTGPGPGTYNLELIHENLDEGNCQFGVTGSWLKEPW
jgi:hypothetical protein